MDAKKTGQFIQTRRKEKQLTQKQLADILGISDKTVSKWETGRGIPDVTFVSQLCEILGISVNELLSGETLSSKEYSSKAEVNMLTLMKALKRGRGSSIIYVSIGVILIVFCMYSLMWIEFAPDDWGLSNWLYEPSLLIIECLFLSAFFLVSSGMEIKERFKLAEKFILSIGAVISLFSLEMIFLRTEEMSKLNVLSVGTCLLAIFYAFGIRAVLIFLEVIIEKTKRRERIKED